MEGAVCAKTIYTPIEKGGIPGVSNETLWKKRARGKKHKSLHRQAKRGTSEVEVLMSGRRRSLIDNGSGTGRSI